MCSFIDLELSVSTFPKFNGILGGFAVIWLVRPCLIITGYDEESTNRACCVRRRVMIQN